MSTCPVTMPRERIGEPTRLCGQPVARYGFCEKHAADHERLCDGCQRCNREPDERFPCGCVRYGDRWVPEDCSVHEWGGLL